MLHISDLNLSFGGQTVLQDFHFHLNPGEISCLLGPSGCGKTTVLRTIAGFETAGRGRITLNGQDLAGIPPHKRGVGMVFQDYALFPHLNVADNIAFGLSGYGKSERLARVAELTGLIGLEDSGKKYPHQLSGGQQQRVALARALAPRPALILLDEPFSNLDADLRQRLSKDVRRLLKQQQTAAILVTHDQHEAFAMADRIAVMQQGRLQQYADAATLYRSPATADVASFIGQGSFLNGKLQSDGYIDCAIGRLAKPENETREGAVRLFIRPEQLEPDMQQPACATVTERDFQGSRCLLHLLLDSGENLLSETQAETAPDTGQRCAVRLKTAPIVFGL